MPTLNIKDPQVHEMAAQLAKLTGQSMTEVVRNALQKSIDFEQARRKDKSLLIARILEISREIASHPVLDPRTPDEIIGYNEYGVPE